MTFLRIVQKFFNNNYFTYLSLITLLFVALIIRLSAVMQSGSNSVGASDDALFLGMARQFNEGDMLSIFHPYWMPFFPFISSILYNFVGSWSYAAGTTSAISGALLLVPIYFIGKSYANRTVGLLAAFLSVFSYPLLAISHSTYTESLYVFLFWIGIFLWIKTLDTNKSIYAFLTGAVWGLTFLTRSEGIAAIIWLLVCNSFLIVKKYLKIPSFYLKIIPFILASFYLIIFGFYVFTIILLIAFFLIYFLFFQLYLLINNNYEIKINLFITTFFVLIGFSIFYFLYNGMLIVKYKKPLFSAKATALLNYPPGGHRVFNKSHTSTWGQDIVVPETFNPNSEFLSNSKEIFFKKQQLITNSEIENVLPAIKIILNFISYPNLIFFFIGIFWLIFKNRDYQKTFLFLLLPAIMVFFVIMASNAGVNDRYTYFTTPFLLLSISFGINHLSTFFKSAKVRIFILLIIITFISKSNLDHLYFKGQSIVINQNIIEYKTFFSRGNVWDSNKNNKETNLLWNKRIMAIREINGFENKGQFIFSPYTTNLEELVNYARRWRVDYIIASPTEIYNFSFLYKNPKNYPGLKLAFSEPDKTIYKVIY